jgi:class 3 adenylate cyclase
MRKLVTVVSCDVVPSRSDGGSQPKTHDEVLRGARLSIRDLLERRGATIQETHGDAITAVFGVPLVHEHDAWRAIRAVVELPAVLDPLGDELQPDSGLELTTRAGISGGVVTIADPGDGRPIAVGEPLTLASQLRQAARPGDVLMTVATHQLVKHVVRAEAVVLYLDGPQHPPVRALRLLELLRGAPARPRHFDSPMIGRERDHRLLAEVLEQATADRTCYLSIVLGEAGIGKSRLVQEFTETVAGQATVLRGQCLWYGDGITFWPLKTVVQEGAALLDNDGPDEIHEKLVALLGDEPQAEAVADQVAQVLGVTEPTGPPEQAFWSVRRLLEAMARAPAGAGVRRHPVGGADLLEPRRAHRRLRPRRTHPGRLPRPPGRANRAPPGVGRREGGRNHDLARSVEQDRV